MKRFNRIFTACAVALAVSALSMSAAAQDYAFKGLTLAPGADSSSIGVAWQSEAQAGSAIVQLAKKADQKGDAFPAAGTRTYYGTSVQVAATVFSGDDQPKPLGTYAQKVVMTGLSDSTDYVYRVGDGKKWSQALPLTTRDPKRFGFFAVGDPQLGSKSTAPKTLEGDAAGWQDTLGKALALKPNASFILSLGDNVNDYNSLPTQLAEYDAFFAPAALRSIPLATVEGNHDFAMGELYGFHYNQPNVSASNGAVYGNDGDYWFSYGNVLFMMLNSSSEGVAAHDIFIRGAIAKNPQAAWRVVCFHHSLYSEADHFADHDIVDRRANYAPVFERYKIDLVFSGHDHAYTRSFPIAKGKPLPLADPKAASVENPGAPIYFTLDSASGSKYYDWTDASPEAFSASRWQGKVPTFSYAGFDGNAFSIATFRTDDGSTIDAFSVVKK